MNISNDLLRLIEHVLLYNSRIMNTSYLLFTIYLRKKRKKIPFYTYYDIES